MIRPETIQAIGDEIVILWEGGKETFYKMDVLRAESPSAENKGESDLMAIGSEEPIKLHSLG